MPSLKARLMNFILLCLPRNRHRTLHDYEAERRRNDRRPPRPPKGVVVEEMELGGIHAERISKAGNGDGLVLYIHGGGFTTGSARERRGICQYIASRHGMNCVSFDYRLSPEHRWPAHLEDCERAYLALLSNGYPPKGIVFMGESAGGTLALALALRLRDARVPLPGAVIAFSPCTNQAEGFASHRGNAKTDHMLRDSVNSPGQYMAVFGSEKPPIELLRSPSVSPYFGDYSDLPPIFLAASDTEALYDDARLLHEKLKREGHLTALAIQHGVCHAYPVFTGIREARRTLSAAFLFLHENAAAGIRA